MSKDKITLKHLQILKYIIKKQSCSYVACHECPLQPEGEHTTFCDNLGHVDALTAAAHAVLNQYGYTDHSQAALDSAEEALRNENPQAPQFKEPDGELPQPLPGENTKQEEPKQEKPKEEEPKQEKPKEEEPKADQEVDTNKFPNCR